MRAPILMTLILLITGLQTPLVSQNLHPILVKVPLAEAVPLATKTAKQRFFEYDQFMLYSIRPKASFIDGQEEVSWVFRWREKKSDSEEALLVHVNMESGAVSTSKTKERDHLHLPTVKVSMAEAIPLALRAVNLKFSDLDNYFLYSVSDRGLKGSNGPFWEFLWQEKLAPHHNRLVSRVFMKDGSTSVRRRVKGSWQKQNDTYIHSLPMALFLDQRSRRPGVVVVSVTLILMTLTCGIFRALRLDKLAKL